MGNEFVRIDVNLKETGRMIGEQDRLTGKPEHFRIM